MVAPVIGHVAVAAGVNAAAKVSGRIGDAFITGVAHLARNGGEINSLADLARPARVEPLAIVDKTLLNQPVLEDIMKMCLTTFSGYYLQAVSLLMNVGRIETLKVFDSLNPNRSMGGVGMREIKEAVWSKEAWADGLPALETFTQPLERGLIATLDQTTVSNEDSDGQSMGPTDKSLDKLYEIENMAVGKLLNVELRDGDKAAKIPVLVRLLPSAVPPQTLTHIFTNGGRDSWKERYHLWRAGQISLVRDLMFGMDLIDEHRKALINDKSGTYATITDRRRNNVRKAALSGTASMADASNIAIVSASTAKAMGAALYGKLDNMAVRQKVFDNSYLLLLVVVDDYHERVTVYHRGLDRSTDYSFREIKSSEKNKGPDITEIFKMFHQSLGANI